MLAGFGNFRRTLLPCRNDYPATFPEEPELPETTEKSEICLIENNLGFSWTFYWVEMHLLFYDNVYSSSSVAGQSFFHSPFVFQITNDGVIRSPLKTCTYIVTKFNCFKSFFVIFLFDCLYFYYTF